jgi:hypothetical protein
MAITQAQQDWLNLLQASGNMEAYNAFANIYANQQPSLLADIAPANKPEIQDTGTTYFALNQPAAEPVAQPTVEAAAPPAAQTVAAPAQNVRDLMAAQYRIVLGREPDEAGLNYWVSQFGPTLEPEEIIAFTQAAQPELEARPLQQVEGLLAAPETGRGEASSATYALNQQVLGLERFRIKAREAFGNPSLLPELAREIEQSNLTSDNKTRANQFLADVQGRMAANPNALTGQYINNNARALDFSFGGLLNVNQANILSLDYTPQEIQEALRVYQASSERITPEDALRAAREYDEEDSLNIGKSFNTSQNSSGQEGILTGSYGFSEAIQRYNPETNTFEGLGRKPAKDVFAAQFNANIGIGTTKENTEGMTDIGEGFFTQKLGNPGAYDLFAVYYQDPNTGKAVQLGTSTNFNPELSGFKKFLNSTAGKILIGVGTGLLLPGVSGLLATGTFGAAGATLGSSLAAGALLGAASSAITGGDILTGAITGGIGGGIGYGVGQAGGLGNVLAGQGILTDPKIIATLNKYVSGINPGLVGLSDDAANAIFQQQYDDLVAAIGQQGADEVFYGVASGTPISAGTASSIAEAGDAVLVTAPSAVPPAAVGGAVGGVIGGIAAPPASVAPPVNTAPPVEVTAPRAPSPVPAPIVPVDVAPPVDVTAPTPPPPAPSPAPIPPIDVAPPVDVVETPTAPDRPGGVPAPIVDLSRPVVPTPDTTIGQDLRNIRDIAADYAGNVIPLLPILGAITPTPPSQFDPNLPSWVYDQSQSGVLNRLNAMRTGSVPIFQPNFNNLFQRGGLGVGQYLGYGLLPRAGDIPGQTLLGVPTLAVNNIGVPIGQANTGAASLV